MGGKGRRTARRSRLAMEMKCAACENFFECKGRQRFCSEACAEKGSRKVSFTAVRKTTTPITANPDVEVVETTPDDDFIVMGCDGIWEKMTNEEMVKYIYDKMQ